MSRHATPYTRALVRQLHLLGVPKAMIGRITGVSRISVGTITDGIKHENDLYVPVGNDIGLDIKPPEGPVATAAVPTGWKIVEQFVSLVEIRAKAIMIERGLSK